MEDREISQFIPYTYAYDQFTAFFYGGRVFLGGKDRPIGQRVVDIMNLDDEVLDEINRRMWQMIPAARALLKENADSAAASVRHRTITICSPRASPPRGRSSTLLSS